MGTDQRHFEGSGDARAGFYTWKDRDYVSVTTAINVLDKPALKRWAAKMVAEKAAAMTKDDATAIARLIDQHGEKAAVDLLKEAPFAYTEKRADVGSEVHKYVEARVLGTPIADPPKEVAPYLRQFDGFLSDNDVTIEAAETTVYSRRFGYAGTLDLILFQGSDKRRYLFDIKTGKNIYPEAALQLAAYRHADFIGLDDGSEQPMPQIDGTCGLRLGPRSYRVVDIRSDQAVFVAFRACLHLWRYRRDVVPGVLSERPKHAIAGVEDAL